MSLVMFWIIVMHVFMSGEIARYIEELSPLERDRERERELAKGMQTIGGRFQEIFVTNLHIFRL